MSHSLLLQLARDSIQEVFEAKNIIDRQAMLKEHPLLNQNISLQINIFLDNELKSTYTSQEGNTSLVNNIIIGAKKAAFESGAVLTTSEYLHSQIEIILNTPEGVISQKDPAIIVTDL